MQKVNPKDFKLIIVHDGPFHGDELCAIAEMRLCGITAPVVRTRTITDVQLNDPLIIIVDVCKRYEPELALLDHHQDRSLPASNILVADWLVSIGLMSADMRECLNKFLTEISNHDLKGPKYSAATSYSMIIRSMGTDDAQTQESRFHEALDLTIKILGYQFEKNELAIADRPKWHALERILNGKVAVKNTTGSIIDWPRLAEIDGVDFMLTESNAGDGWLILSRDSKLFPIPAHPDQTFRHGEEFMAKYPDKEKAVKHLTEILSAIADKDTKPNTVAQAN